jgi:hypothetical protein
MSWRGGWRIPGRSTGSAHPTSKSSVMANTFPRFCNAVANRVSSFLLAPRGQPSGTWRVVEYVVRLAQHPDRAAVVRHFFCISP